MCITTLGKLYFNYLREEGYAPKYDNDGDVIFKSEGKTLIVSINERDQSFIRLILPNFWELESEMEASKALRVANEVNHEIKVAKIVIVQENVWATAEIFIDSTPDFDDFFNRLIAVVLHAQKDFGEKMLASGGGRSDLPIKLIR